MARPDKLAAVDEIAGRFRAANASVITEFRGLSVSRLTALRRALGSTATFRIAKNTLVRRAAEQAGVDGLDDLLIGPTAIAFVTGEPVDAAKVLRNFARDNKGLVIKGGVMDGRPLSVAEVERLAELESREVLLASLAGAMKANLSKAAGLLAAPASQLARLAAALRDKLEADTGAPDAGSAEDAEPSTDAGSPANAQPPAHSNVDVDAEPPAHADADAGTEAPAES